MLPYHIDDKQQSQRPPQKNRHDDCHNNYIRKLSIKIQTVYNISYRM